MVVIQANGNSDRKYFEGGRTGILTAFLVQRDHAPNEQFLMTNVVLVQIDM